MYSLKSNTERYWFNSSQFFEELLTISGCFELKRLYTKHTLYIEHKYNTYLNIHYRNKMRKYKSTKLGGIYIFLQQKT